MVVSPVAAAVNSSRDIRMNVHSLAQTYSGKCIVQAQVRPLKWSLFVSLFVVASVALPLAAHQFSPQVGRMLLPMHFFALTAGVVMGWRAGLVVGAASPIVSFLLSGLPTGPSLGILTAEIAVYGLLAGLLQARPDVGKDAAPLHGAHGCGTEWRGGARQLDAAARARQ